MLTKCIALIAYTRHSPLLPALVLLLAMQVGLVGIGHAQNQAIDSLKNELATHQESDAKRLSILNELVYQVFEIDATYAEELLKEAMPLADSLDIKELTGLTLYFSGQTALIKGDYTSGVRYLRLSMRTYDSIGHLSGVSYSLNGIGVAYYDQGNLDSALLYYQKSLALDQQRGDSAGVAASHNNLANIYADQGKYELSVEEYNKGLIIREAIDDMEGTIKVHTNLGDVYREQGNLPKALEHFNKALLYYEKVGNTENIRYLFSNLGATYKIYGDLSKALHYFNQGLSISKQIGNSKAIVISLNDLGETYATLAMDDKAKDCFSQAFDLSIQFNDKPGLIRALTGLGMLSLQQEEYTEAYASFREALRLSAATDVVTYQSICYYGLSLASYQQADYDMALSHAFKGKELAIKHQQAESHRDILSLLAQIYGKLLDFKQAYVAQSDYKQLSDSLFNAKMIQKIAALEYEYKYQQEREEAARKELVLSHDLASSENQKFTIIIGSLVLIILTLVGLFWQRIRRLRLERASALMEQKLLRSQMAPHFVFNSLSVLQGIILNKEYQKSITYLSKFSKLLRLTLENSRDKTVRLSDEIAAIEKYLEVQNLGSDSPIEYQLSVSGITDQNALKIPPMMIQPFVENAVEHAFDRGDTQKEIAIDFKMRGKELMCEITDNGRGIDALQVKTQPAKKSLSTTITTERLALFSKEFNVPTGLRITDRKESGKQGTIVTLILPYKLKQA